MPFALDHSGPVAPSRVAVIVPAYNEGPHISGVISTIPAWVDDVIVVDDASTDGTAATLASLSDPRVTIIQRESNGGVGAAMIDGYRAALELGADVAVKMDADGQMHPEDLARLVRPVATGLADYAKGNRFYFRNATLGMPKVRGFGNSLLSFLTKAASGYWHVFDSQCGYTAIRCSFLRLLDLSQIANDYYFENDMLIGLNSLNARVFDVPVTTLYGEETSHVNVSRVALTFPPRLAASGVRRFWRKYLITDFGAVAILTVTGVALMGFGAVWGAYHWWLSISRGIPATSGTVMIAVLPLILGFQLVLQALALSVTASPGARESAEYVRLLIAEGAFE